MRFVNLSIAKKIAVAFAVIIVGAAAMGTAMRSNMQSIEAAQSRTDANNAIIAMTLEARGALTRQENSLRGFLVTKDTYYADRLKKHRATFEKYLADLSTSPGFTPEMAATVEKVKTDLAAWHTNIAQRAITLATDPVTFPDAVALLGSDAASSYIDPVEEALDGMKEQQRAAIAQESAAQVAAFSTAQITLFSCMALLIAAAVVLAMLMSRGIARPVVQLRDAMRRLAEGDSSIAVPALGRTDEVGQMAEAFEKLKQVSLDRERLGTAAEAARQTEESRNQQSAIESDEYARAHAFFMSEVQTGFERIAAGDLLARLEKPFSADYEGIRVLFNDSIGALEQAMTAVVQSIDAIRTGLGEITVASNDLAQRTEQQAASLEETVAALSDVTRGVNQTAEGAAKAQLGAADAQQSAEKGGTVVGHAVGAMQDIADSSDKISKIIGVIDEIAFQTNLLALNAGVEAARAGEAGRGFAVVAQEVRGLAQRSAEAAKEIKDLISTSSRQVGQGVELVTASGRSLQDIVAQVADMSSVVGEIASNARQQATSLREVSMAADQMDKVTQQNAAMVEQTTAAAQTLSQETEGLAVLIGRFNLSASSGRPRSAQGRSAASRPASGSPRTKSAVVQMRQTGQQSHAPQAASDSWEEF